MNKTEYILCGRTCMLYSPTSEIPCQLYNLRVAFKDYLSEHPLIAGKECPIKLPSDLEANLNDWGKKELGIIQHAEDRIKRISKNKKD